MEYIDNFITRSECRELTTLMDKYADRFSDSSGVRGKIGINGKSSIFHTLKYWNYPTEIKDAFERIVPADMLNNFNESWFLRFKQNGFFDKYKAKGTLFNIVTIPLRDGMRFLIDDQLINTIAGRGIKFNLGQYHEVPLVTTASPNDYLVFIVLT